MREEPMDKESKNQDKKRNLRLVEKYDNDDYSRYSGPDYSDETFELGEEDFEQSPHTRKREINVRPHGNWHHPGVSGKSDEETWVNQEEYNDQTDFTGYGPKNYKRSDDRIYEEVCDALQRDRYVDASNVGVKVQTGVVFLSGKVNSRQIKKRAEEVVEGLPGVQDVRNELTIVKSEEIGKGPDAATKKDLGIY
jgi:hypothetical protein